MTRILVTNDDGYRSEGIRALADVLAPLGEVTIVAPIEEASAIGHALTLRRPLRLEHIADKTYADKLKAALEGATGRKLLLAFEVGDATSGSLAARERKAREEAHAQGEQAFREEPFVRDLVARFDATVKSDTITPLRGDPPAS